MKRLPIYILLLAAVAALVPSCKGDDDQDILDTYAEWRQQNETWLTEQQARTNPDGTPYYKSIVPSWNPATYVLIHYFNDTEETKGNLQPMLTSTIDTRYIVHYCNDVPMDSSYRQTTYGPGIFRTRLNEVIEGWAIAFETMHVGDTAEIIVPYMSAYGASIGSGVPPYSNLRFNVRLVDIPFYETSSK